MDTKMSRITVTHIFAQIFLLVMFFNLSLSYRSVCELTCEPETAVCAGGKHGSANISPLDCSEVPIRRNSSNSAAGKIALKTHPSIHQKEILNLNVVLSEMKFNYFLLTYTETDKTDTFCHSYNITSIVPESKLTISHDCVWTDSDSGTQLEVKYQSYDEKFALINKGHFLFNLPSPHRIGEHETSLNNWELFLYVDLSDFDKIGVKWPAPPVQFGVEQFLLKIYYDDCNSTFRVLESHRIPVDTENREEESFIFETGLSGKFYFTVQMLHENCTNTPCFISTSPIFLIENHYKSPLILGVISLLILLPGIIYILYSWRRFGTPPPHKVPVVLLIYRRTMDSHFRVIVALVMYLRKACHIRALIEDFDILSADSEDSSSWYLETFTHVDSVMVISSPHCVGLHKDQSFYNVNPVALRILKEKSRDKSCPLKLFSVVLPYCTKKDIPKEARNLPVFRLPEDLNSVLWFIRFGPTKSCFSKLEYFLFQSQISGGTCDFSTYGKFLREALIDADEESRRLKARLAIEQMV